METRKTTAGGLTHQCHYCGHQGKCRGKGAELVHEGRGGGSIRAVYSCRDVEACGGRLRARRPVGWKPADDGLPF
jgi:hypothetical protein